MAYTGKLQLFRGIPLNIDNEDTFYFASRSAQDNYFYGQMDTRLTFGAEDFKFVREDGYVKVSRPHDYLENCNYMRFQNQLDAGGYQTVPKWYYAFITGIDYINDTTTGIHFVIDVLQTWLPNIDYQLNDCFIVREHATSDKIGENLATETVMPYKKSKYETKTTVLLSNTFYVGVMFMYQEEMFSYITASAKHDTSKHKWFNANMGTCKTDGTVTGANVILFKVEPTSGSVSNDGLDNLRTALKQSTTPLSSGAYISAESIISMFILPSIFVDENSLVPVEAKVGNEVKWTGYTYPTRISDENLSAPYEDYTYQTKSVTITPAFETNKIGTYEPKNKKLLTSQYVNYEVVNLEGNTAVYEPEGFLDENDEIVSPEFDLLTTALPPNKIAIVPSFSGNVVGYYGTIDFKDQMISAGELPSVSAKVSTYENWLMRQFVQKIQTAMPIAFSAIASHQLTPQIANMADQASKFASRPSDYNYDITRYMAQKEMVKNTRAQAAQENTPRLATSVIRHANDIVTTERPVPISAGNGNNLGNILAARSIAQITFRKNAPIYSELERIDNYFTAYGYAQGIIAKPHVKVRSRFTYIKTQGARNTAKYEQNNNYGIPAEYLKEINSLFDQGIRFWVGQDFSDLTSANTILNSSSWDN